MTTAKKRISNKTALSAQPAKIIRKITGRMTIAEGDWSPRERARMAAEWKIGNDHIARSTKMAASVFGVSVPLVVEASNELKKAKRRNGSGVPELAPIETLRVRMSDTECDAFVSKHVLSVWDSIERVTR